jgi:ABC-type glycerol-3-phosphate transport system substrate-binding protein
VKATKRRNVLSGFVVAGGTVAHAACGAPGGAAAPGAAATRTRTYQGVVLHHMGAPTDPAGQRTHERMLREIFEPAHPGVRVEDIALAGLSTLEKLVTLLAAGTPPDSARMNGYHVAQVAKQFGLLDVGAFAARDRHFSPRDMYEGAWRAGQYRGKQYGVASGMTPTVLMYNKDHFDEAGLPYPPADFKNAPWTWNRAREDAKKLARRDSSGQLVRAGIAFDAAFLSRFEATAYAFGARLVDRRDDPTRCLIDEPPSTAMFQFLRDLIHVDRTAPPTDWYVRPGTTGTAAAYQGLPYDNGILFREGKVAMAIALTDLAANRAAATLKWDYAPLPRANADGKPGGAFSNEVFVGTRGTKDPELTWDWLAAVGGPQLAEWNMLDPAIVRTPAWRPLQQQYAQSRPPDNIRVVVDVGEYGQPTMMTPAYADIEKELLGRSGATGLRPIWNDEAPLRQTLGDLARRLSELLRQTQ